MNMKKRFLKSIKFLTSMTVGFLLSVYLPKLMICVGFAFVVAILLFAWGFFDE